LCQAYRWRRRRNIRSPPHRSRAQISSAAKQELLAGSQPGVPRPGEERDGRESPWEAGNDQLLIRAAREHLASLVNTLGVCLWKMCSQSGADNM